MSAPRYRCSTCGNLTRFDVTTTRRVRAFHHYTVGGELTVEEPEVLEEAVETVECRWCGPSGTVVPLEDDPPGGAVTPLSPSRPPSAEPPGGGTVTPPS